MNSQFDEIGQIISIGALFMIGIGILFRNHTDLKTVFKELMAFKLPPLLIAPVFLAMLYSMGILVQSISKNAIANRGLYFPIPELILPSDATSRSNSFDSLYIVKCTKLEQRKFDTLYCKVLENNEVKKAIEYKQDEKNKLFFYSKNRIFSETKFNPELKSIESRLFFATSLTFSSFYLVIFLIVVMFFYAIKICKEKGEEKKKKAEEKKKRVEAENSKAIEDDKVNKVENEKVSLAETFPARYFSKYKFEVYCLVILILLVIAGSVSYRSIQDSFNFRIFGYYVTSIS